MSLDALSRVNTLSNQLEALLLGLQSTSGSLLLGSHGGELLWLKDGKITTTCSAAVALTDESARLLNLRINRLMVRQVDQVLAAEESDAATLPITEAPLGVVLLHEGAVVGRVIDRPDGMIEVLPLGSPVSMRLNPAAIVGRLDNLSPADLERAGRLTRAHQGLRFRASLRKIVEKIRGEGVGHLQPMVGMDIELRDSTQRWRIASITHKEGPAFFELELVGLEVDGFLSTGTTRTLGGDAWETEVHTVHTEHPEPQPGMLVSWTPHNKPTIMGAIVGTIDVRWEANSPGMPSSAHYRVLLLDNGQRVPLEGFCEQHGFDGVSEYRSNAKGHWEGVWEIGSLGHNGAELPALGEVDFAQLDEPMTSERLYHMPLPPYQMARILATYRTLFGQELAGPPAVLGEDDPNDQNPHSDLPL